MQKTPASLSTLIPNRFQDVHKYNTRHNNACPLPRTQTSLYASYFLPSTLKLWNSLPPEIKVSPSLSILKSILTSRVHHDIVPKYYYYGPRLTQILHARLRMRSNSLNEHLYIKDIIDNPNCLCVFNPIQKYFSYIMATSFSGGGSRSTRREPPTMSKQLVNFIT